MAINAITASYGSFAVAAVSPAYSTDTINSQPAAAPKTDTVQLSGAALALSLAATGDSPEEIASILGLDINTVDDYLGILPAAANTTAAATAPTVNAAALASYTVLPIYGASTFSVTA